MGIFRGRDVESPLMCHGSKIHLPTVCPHAHWSPVAMEA